MQQQGKGRSRSRQLQFFFLPALAHGHMIPMVDMARAVASRGVTATIVTTPVNAALISKSIHRTSNLNILTIKFPYVEGLPEGCENADSIPPHLLPKAILATSKMQDSVDQVLREHCPHCLVADNLYPWATDVSARYNIPRLVFHVTYFFSLCAARCVGLYEPFKNVISDSELVEIPNLPGAIRITRARVGLSVDVSDGESEMGKFRQAIAEAGSKCHGHVVNSFHELEPAYADFFKKEMGTEKTWNIGPLMSLCNAEEKAYRGNHADIDGHESLKWLDSKEPNSVVYVCFGSMTILRAPQLREIALALEACRHRFMWVVRKPKYGAVEEVEWLPEGFEERMEGRGLIIRGWAPQLLILEHKATGAFMTHCGSNSTLEGVAAGLPMVTWPMFGDHFLIEQLMTDVLKVGVSVGCKQHVGMHGDSVTSEAIEKAVRRLMDAGEEADERRERARRLAEMAQRAVKEGGSSCMDLEALIEDIASHVDYTNKADQIFACFDRLISSSTTSSVVTD